MEIREEHREWATVHRMREMLSGVRGEFEVTHTYSLFGSILCWTMQGLRPDDHERGRVSDALRDCAMEIAALPIGRFLHVQPREINNAAIGASRGTNMLPLNSFHDFHDPKTGKQFRAFRCLKALRNAVGHGDAKRVTPVNRGNQLIAYTFACTEAHPTNSGNWVETWSGRVCLDRRGMANIGCELASQYCNAISAGYPGLEKEAQTILERR